MKDYPFVKCLHPQRVVNPYTREVIVVPCGKCEVCKQTRAGINTLKCELESLSHKYCMFVTLTYDNDHIPLAELVPNVNIVSNFNEYELKDLPFKPQDNVLFKVDRKTSLGYHLMNVTERLGVGEVLGHYIPERVSMVAEIKRKLNLNGYIPYLSKRDLQLFIKRLRKKCNEKIRYYAVGEYGPVHFRPHYHLLLWFEEDETFKAMYQNIRACWQYGRVDASLSQGKCSSYVASYVNSDCYLPQIYKFDKTRTFCTHSYFLGEQYLQKSKKEVYEGSFKDFVKRSVPINGSYTDVTVWRSLKTVYFPKCKGYSQKSDMELYYTYRTYTEASEITGETSPYRQARFIADFIRGYGFFNENPNFDRLLCYFHHSLQIKECALHSAFDYNWLVRAIYMELRVSRHFLDFVRPYFGSSKKAIEKIKWFYDSQDYDNLKNWYELQVQYFHDGWEIDTLNLFYNNFEQEDLEECGVYRNFRSSRLSTFQNSIKHKKLNDLNKIFENQ